MKTSEKNYLLLATAFVVALTTSNVVTGKVITTGIPFMGSTITIAGGAATYWITFLITDVVGELWGKSQAQKLVWLGFFGQIMATSLIFITTYLPAAEVAAQEAYVTLLGQNWVFVVASLMGYLASQMWDVMIFHRIRAHYNGAPSKRWIWNNASTMTSQIIDTIIFIGIAFGLGFGWLFDSELRVALLAMMVGQYFLKFVCALIDTPFFYLFTHKK